MRQKISAIVSTYNEEDNIEDCLKTLSWTDELIVVDSFSSDKTVSIAKKYTDKVIQHEYEYPAKQKNWIIPQVSNKWLILLDADERVTTELKGEILQLLEKVPEKSAYWIYRRNFFLGKEIKHCGWQKDRVVRLFTKEHLYEDVRLHEEIKTMKEQTGVLSGKLIHYSYKNMRDYFIKLERYSKWGAEKSFEKGKKANLLNILFAPLGMFFKRYVFNFGFLDGIHGLILSLLAAVSVSVKYIRLWELQKTKLNHQLPRNKTQIITNDQSTITKHKQI